jgi:hypothetical protein
LRGRWAEVRYRWLLPLARLGRPHGRVYARLAARVEYGADAERSRVAARRIARALGIGDDAASAVYRRCLESEALEEADSVRFMQRSALDPGLFRIDPMPAGGESGVGTVYGTLHFGSPVFGYLGLRSVLDVPASMVGRPLDDANPMPAAKRAYAHGKVRWVERISGRPFLGTDAAAMAGARDELLAGRALYTPIDVPGSVAGRAATVQPFDEPIRLASGLMTLARLAGADVVPVVTLRRPDGFVVHFGRRLAPAKDAHELLAAALGELALFVRAHPDEWWMWPYLEPAR